MKEFDETGFSAKFSHWKVEEIEKRKYVQAVFTVWLGYKTNGYTTTYFKGIACAYCKAFNRDYLSFLKPYKVSTDKSGILRLDSSRLQDYLIRQVQTGCKDSTLNNIHAEPPTKAEVLACLASDYYTIDGCFDFEEWATEVGYDPDSRKAEKIYEAIIYQTKELEKLYGMSRRTKDFQDFMRFCNMLNEMSLEEARTMWEPSET